ncbi:MAG: LysR family transcriptional regulator [Myxococcota bacterium]
MYDWSDLRYFLAVHREGTLVAAGRSLRVDPTTVGRRIAALEEGLRTKLFVRGSRGWVATPAGRRMVPAAERAEGAATDVIRLAGGESDRPVGRVRISTIETVASQMIAPRLPDLRAQYPELRVDLWCTPHNVDISRGEADLALRIGRPTDPTLIARRLLTVQSRLYAARSWLEGRGLNEELTDLEGKEALLLLARHPWVEEAPRIMPVMRSTELSAIVQACVAGLGMALLPDILAEPYPELVPLNAAAPVYDDPVWLVTHPDLVQVPRVRAVTDWLVEMATHAG